MSQNATISPEFHAFLMVGTRTGELIVRITPTKVRFAKDIAK